MPLRHKDAKVHKKLSFNDLCFVQLCVFVASWQKKDFSKEAQNLKI